jgi:adenine/guanine/hypoxanthine permease
MSLTPAWEWSFAYALMGLIFLSAKWLCVKD